MNNSANARSAENAKRYWEAKREEVLWLYNIRNLSQQQMAEHFGISLRGMQHAMKRLGIPSKSRGRRGHMHHEFKDGKSSRLYRTMVVKDKCRKCGMTENLSIHHKNDDHYDNRLENLEVLCNSCHMSETKKKWWAAKRAGKATPKSNGLVGWKRHKELPQS